MKRIAIQFFGHLRTFDKTYKSFFKNVVKPNIKDGYEIDIFIHTWTEREHSTVSFRNPRGEDFVNSNLTEELINKAKEVYKAKVFLIEDQINLEDKFFHEKLFNSKKSLKGVVNMTYTIYKSNFIRQVYEKENNIKYDWIVVTRPDIEFLSSFRIDSLLEDYNKRNINIPINNIFYATKIFARAKVNDTIFLGGSDLLYFGRPESISKATSIYKTWTEYNNCLEIMDYEDFYSFESWLIKYWEKQSLEPIQVEYVTIQDFYPKFNKIKISISNMLPKLRKSLFFVLKYILPYNFIVWLQNKIR